MVVVVFESEASVPTVAAAPSPEEEGGEEIDSGKQQIRAAEGERVLRWKK